ncbi:BEN domain-containing protein 5-like isoform X1 [Chiloscyllium plagiosum]|uniref:BEN domain-containing protein 5-like isoform X1 n=1 Tax=Chiloscyllium plagiosum TaxID=36176 RepID=UPI001CB83A30|nr:BEN domain-containing protein 5-like isoform X1 [Chiloscyllium plagiosum]
MFACVRFLQDQVHHIIPVSHIKNFNPTSKCDFNKKQVYRLALPGAGPAPGSGPGAGETETSTIIKGGHCRKAQILALGDSRQELEKFLKLKKCKVPKIIESFVEVSESEDGDSTEDEVHQLSNIQEQGASCFEDSSDDDDQTLKIFDELKHKYSRAKANNKRLIQELKKVTTKLRFAEEKQKEYEHLASELQRLRDLNMDLQNALLLKLFRLPEQYHGSNPEEELVDNTSTHQMISSTPVTSILQDHLNMQQRVYPSKKSPHALLPTPSTSDHLESQIENGNNMVPCPWASTQAIALTQPNVYSVQDGKVHIGANIWIDEDKWETVKRQPSDSRFTKCLAVAVWGVDTLKDRSVTGIACNSTKSSPKPPLSPYKVQIIKEQLLNRIRQDAKDDNEIHKRLNKVNRYIGEKIMDINKQWRKAKADISKFRNCECEIGLKCEIHAHCERSEVPIKEEIETFIYE